MSLQIDNRSEGGFIDLQVKHVVFVGAGFVGGPTAAVLASNANDVDITVVDIDRERIQAWNSDRLPISEPGLEALVLPIRCGEHERLPFNPNNQGKRKNLCFSHDIDLFVKQADMIFLCVDTPAKQTHTQMGMPDLTTLRYAVDQIGRVVDKNFILVEKSTVPVGTATYITRQLLEVLEPAIDFEVLSNPEFLAEGDAINNLLRPDRVLIGSSPTPEGRHAAVLLADLYSRWLPYDKIITSDLWSSELSKLCANALLAQRISSINSLGMICERLGADIREVSKIVKADHRIGPHMLSSSIGFGGSCFLKDVAHLAYLASSLGLEDVAAYWSSVLAINEKQKINFADRIFHRLATSHLGRKGHVAILGYAFKAETNDIRNSPAIDIAKRLLLRYDVRIYDPLVSADTILASLPATGSHSTAQATYYGTTTVSPTAEEACEGAYAVCVLTEWAEFCFPPQPAQFQIQARTAIDWNRIARMVKEPKLLFDGRQVLHDSIAELGFQLERVGKRADDLHFDDWMDFDA